MRSSTPQQLADRPVQRSVVWRGDRTVASNVSIEQIADRSRRRPRRQGLVVLLADRGGDEPHRRPARPRRVRGRRRDRPARGTQARCHGDTVIVVSAAIAFDAPTAELTVQRVSILATQRALVLIADDGPLATPGAVARPVRRPDAVPTASRPGCTSCWKPWSTATPPRWRRWRRPPTPLTSALFDDKPMGKAEQLRAFRMRQAISHLRKVASPMTEVTASLASAAARTPNAQDDDPVADLLAPSTGPPVRRSSPITPGTPRKHHRAPREC